MYSRALLLRPKRLPALYVPAKCALAHRAGIARAAMSTAVATEAAPMPVSHTPVPHALSALPAADARPARPAADPRIYPYYVAYTEEGTVRVDVRKSPQLIGQSSSRGTREYNQDRAEFIPLRIPGMVADRKDRSSAQIMYLGVYDGHGGDACSDYLKQVLHRYIESVGVNDLQSVLSDMRLYGKDWSSYTPDALRCLEESVLKYEVPSFLTIDERLTLAFLRADNDIKNMRWSDGQGSTACTALLWDAEGLPFWSHDSQLNLVIANVGDCKAILCKADKQGGLALALNTLHHPGVYAERERLQSHGAFFSRDSFGEERAMARVANTRAFGDWQVKRFGVFSEPEIRHYEIQGDEAAFMVIVSDGLTSVLTDQEIVDIVKGCADPSKAAKQLVDIAERLGSDDNMTAQVLRLPGWDCSLKDLTAQHREMRLNSVDRIRRLRGSMLVGAHGSTTLNELHDGAGAGVHLALPDRLLKRIFTTHQRPRRQRQGALSSSGDSSLAQGLQLTVAQIQQRIRASGCRLTLVAEPEEVDLDSDEDSGSVIAVPEVMRMTLSVLGMANASMDASNHDCALTTEQENTCLTLQQTDKAWRLIGLHVIEA
ncbi:Protein phosphatase 2C 6 [Coemansia sp. RSA 2336]|nr:Protein phosphatase 2C 6 [Coemansia sp. RSA 2336]